MNPNQHARRLAEARQRQARLQMQTLHTTLTETRDDVKWLRRGLQALLEHLTCDQSGRADGNQSNHQPHLRDQYAGTVAAAGGNAVQEMGDAAFQNASHRGPPPTCPSVQQLSRHDTGREGRPPTSRTDTHQPTSDSRSEDESRALQRLADALGWDQVPQLSEAEKKESDLELQAALVQARRFYHKETGEFERGWDAALQLAVEVVAGARDGDQAQQWLRHVLHARTGPDNEPVAELADQHHPMPIRSADELVQPGMFDSDEELEEFLIAHRRCR